MTIGPFSDEASARKAAHEIIQPHPGSPILDQAQNAQLLGIIAGRAGLELGAYDARIANWLTGFTDANCAVIAGWISRAYEAGKNAPAGK